MEKNIQGLTQLQIFASSICNLSCKYCYLQDQHENSAYAILNKEIQQAWLDGSYVINIKKVFDTFNSSPMAMKTLSFWGGEPLIMVKNLFTPIKELLDFFPNVSNIFFSTNFYKIDNLIDLIYIIDNHINHEINVVLQLSIDAPPGELQTKGHQVDWSQYKQNIDTIISSIANRGGLKYTKIILLPHAALSWQDIKKYLSSFNQINNYCNYFKDFFQYILQQTELYKLSEKIIIIRESLFPTITDPNVFSIEDGLLIQQIIKILKYIQYQNNYNKETVLYQDFLQSLKPSFILTGNDVCFTNGQEGATILPDGTVCGCFCDYILNTPKYWDWIKDNPLKRKEYRQALLKHRLYINPLTATSLELEDYNWYIFENIKENTSTSIHLIINLALELAKSGQIDYKYYQNIDLLLSHLRQFSHAGQCSNDQLQTVLTTHLISVDYLRKFLNGGANIGQNDAILLEKRKNINEIKKM